MSMRTDGDAVIRDMTAEDVEAVYAIERSSFFSPWSKANMTGELENRSACNRVLTMGERVVGYYFSWHIAGESSLNNISVAQDYRGCGYGDLLMRDFLLESRKRGAQELFLEVSVANAPALGLYHKHGFETVATRKNYYEAEHLDAYVLRRIESEGTCTR